MSMWVKICANTSLADAQHAVRAGANAVGFVFAAASKRCMTPEQVAAITPYLPVSAEKFGVFVEQSVEEIADIVRAAGLTGVQMHMPKLATAASEAAKLREMLADRPQRLSVVHVLHFNPAEPATLDDELALLSKNHAIDAVLIDSRTAHSVGGTGITYDWPAAQKSFLRAAPQLRMIVAGGLTPGNVRRAILTLGPWGVDVASGVESVPGTKDFSKVESFISTARQAGEEVSKTRVGAEA